MARATISSNGSQKTRALDGTITTPPPYPQVVPATGTFREPQVLPQHVTLVVLAEVHPHTSTLTPHSQGKENHSSQVSLHKASAQKPPITSTIQHPSSLDNQSSEVYASKQGIA